MAKETASLDHSKREGHGGPEQDNLKVKKGSFLQVGSAIEMNHTAISPNRKSGSSSGGEQ